MEHARVWARARMLLGSHAPLQVGKGTVLRRDHLVFPHLHKVRWMRWCPSQDNSMTEYRDRRYGLMPLSVPVTDDLVRAYQGTNRWHTREAPFDSGIPCSRMGPSSSKCTLLAGHSGLHVAHRYAVDTVYDHNTIYEAWYEHDPDLETDVGL